MIEPTPAPRSLSPIPGKDYPSDLLEFRGWFPDDAACIDYLEWLRWPDGVCCPRCDSADVQGRASARFRCHGCWYTFSLTSGTIFEKTRTPLTVWFEAAWLITTDKSGVSAAHLHRVLPISSYQTAWAMLAKFRQVMAASEREPLSGRVEVDESFFGGRRSGVRGRGALGKTLVAGAIEADEHGWGRARMAVIPDASSVTLRAFITTNITPGTIVVSDGLRSYPGVLAGYTHDTINVSASGRPAHEALPAVHRIFAQAKRMIEGTYQGSGSSGHLSEYLDEFVFRFNRRKSHHPGLVFMRLVQRATQGAPVSYRELVREPRPKAVQPKGVTGKRTAPRSLEIESPGRTWRYRA